MHHFTHAACRFYGRGILFAAGIGYGNAAARECNMLALRAITRDAVRHEYDCFAAACAVAALLPPAAAIVIARPSRPKRTEAITWCSMYQSTTNPPPPPSFPPFVYLTGVVRSNYLGIKESFNKVHPSLSPPASSCTLVILHKHACIVVVVVVIGER